MGPDKTFSRLLFAAIFKKWQRKVGFGPIEPNAEAGTALPIAICRENGDAMREFVYLYKNELYKYRSNRLINGS